VEVVRPEQFDDETIFLRARHVVTENRRVLAMGEALSRKQYDTAGELMIRSHASLRDDFESSCVEVDTLVDICSATEGVYGARMTGGGFGGSVVALTERDLAEAASVQIQRDYEEATGLRTDVIAVAPVAGAAEVPVSKRAGNESNVH
ncbi:MAG: hypothetical protein AAGA61_09410, partial [Pseudomonadota bacterium]